MRESDLSRLIQIELAQSGVRLFRFHVGEFKLARGGVLVVGVPGMSDLLGYTPVTITPAMVGQTVAVFTACEVKTPGGYTEVARLAKQQQFIHIVQRAGGLAGFARSPQDARAICTMTGQPGTEG